MCGTPSFLAPEIITGSEEAYSLAVGEYAQWGEECLRALVINSSAGLTEE